MTRKPTIFVKPPHIHMLTDGGDPNRLLQDSRSWVTGVMPYLTTPMKIEGPNDPAHVGDTLTVTRGRWNLATLDPGSETLTLDGVDVLGDVIDNGGTWEYTTSSEGLLEYTATPPQGPVRRARREIILAPPTNTALPIISFTGDDWAVTPGTWNNANNVTTVVKLDGVTVGMTGTFTSADDGKTMLVTETATNTEGPTVVTVSRIYFEALEPPVNTAPPEISITGNNWTVTPGDWIGADTIDTAVTLGGVAVGLTGTLTAADDGKTLLVTETATNDDGTIGPVSVSNVVSYIAPPVNASLPTITWDGNDWTVTPGTWTGADSVSTVVKLGAATVGMTGTLTAADDSKTLLVTETATNIGGSTVETVSDVAEYIVPSVTFVASSYSDDSLTIDLPAGIQAGDLCIIASAKGSSRNHVTPTGFTPVGSGGNVTNAGLYIFQKILTGSETTLPVFTGTTSRIISHAIVFRNAELLDHVYMTNSYNPPDIDAVADGAVVIFGGFATTSNTGGLHSMPSGYTQTISVDPGNNWNAGMIAGYKLTSTTGTEDPGQFIYRSIAYSISATIALGPAS